MLIAVIGTPASASTWVFNAIRGILAEAGVDALSLYAETGDELLHNIPLGSHAVVIKAHSVDRHLIKLLALSGAQVVVTDRCPQDCFISQRERFGLPQANILSQLTRAYASTAMIKSVLTPLLLQYEDRFFAEAHTMRLLVGWLGITVSDAMLSQVFDRLDAGRVRAKVDDWAQAVGLATPGTADFAVLHDHATQLHPNHVGDRRSGKGKEQLPPRDYEALSDCCSNFTNSGRWQTGTVRWDRSFFRYTDERDPAGEVILETTGEERLMVFGPYLYLPTGYWQVVPLLQTEYPTLPAELVVDVFTIRRGIVNLRRITLPALDVQRTALEFEHVDHLDPVEVRFSSTGDGNRIRMVFLGVELRWLGPCSAEPGLSSRRVDDPGLLSA